MILSIITCTFKPSNLEVLLDSLNACTISDKFEIIIVNQSGENILYIEKAYPFCFKIVVPTERLSAANARNFGASNSTSEFLHFIDDDAFFTGLTGNTFDKLLSCLEEGRYEMYVAQRGEVSSSGNYVTHWPSTDLIDIKNFPRFIIEWNFFIKATRFNALGKFPDIGTGSNHMAQSGEVFVIAAKFLALNLSIQKLPFITIAHPSLTTINKRKKLMYLYGAGYAVGLSTKFMKVNDRMYWILRSIVSAFKPSEFSLYKIKGLVDAINNKLPRKIN